MKKISTLLILLCFITNIFAQNDSDAAILLEKISIKYKKYNTAAMKVKLTIDVPEADKSVVLLSQVWLKGDKYKIDFEDKMMMSNTVSMWTYYKDINELQIGNYDPTSIVFLPSKLFDIYSDKFIYRVKEEFKNSNGDLIKNIELTPINKDGVIFKIVVSINTKTMEIIETRMFEKSGYKYSYNITEMKTNITLEDAFFEFDIIKYNIDSDDITDWR